MSSIGKDARFSRVLTDPRFKPMPTFQKKVKIDKRFNALFTSKDFGHRTLMDKRGRPIHDVSKRGKHVMEQFYELSSDSSSSEEEGTAESDDDEDEESDTLMSESAEDGSATSKIKSKKKKDVKITENKKNLSKQKLKKKEKKTTQEDDDSEKETLRISPTRKKLQKKSPKTSTKRSHGEEDGEDSDQAQPDTKKSKKGQKSPASDLSDESDEVDDDDDDESSSESDDSSSDDEELPEYTNDFDLEETAVEHKWNELHKGAPQISESTHRLAVCNMDWDFVKAQDLFVLFKSFATDGGSVGSVTIYPSEYGKERMAEEAVLGPKEMRDSWKNGQEEQSAADGGDDSKSRKNARNRRKLRIMDQERLRKVEKENVKVEREVLRDYQLNRLRYYYAVVDCSSVEVADNIYNECDGQEYQLSCVKLDLRFIPDDMTFEDTPKESFSKDQGLVDYTPKRFNSTALSQAKVEVTWDETDFDRLQRSMLLVQHKELEEIVDENKYADIIAPPESDSDFEEDGRPQWLKKVLAGGDSDDDDDDVEDISEERKISLYRKVLMDKITEEEEKEKNDNKVDKELEWQPGLRSAVAKNLKKSENDKVQGSLVDDFLEKRKEKKKKKRELKKAARKEDGDDDGDDDNNDEGGGDDEDMPDIIDEDLKRMMEGEGIDVTSMASKKKKKEEEEDGSKKKKKKKKVEPVEGNSEDERERAELELLLMGDGDEKSLAKPEKIPEEGKLSRRQKKKRALQERDQKKKDKEDLHIDVDDPRFSAMFSSHHFHIDPNAPEFKKTSNMMKLVDEQIKRKPEKDNKRKLMSNGGVAEEIDSKAVSKKLLESLKRKMKK